MEDMTWHNLFQLLITLLVGFAGAPVTQLFKAALNSVFKTTVEDRWALLLTAVVGFGMALLEMALTGVLGEGGITLQNFPQHFFTVFSLATVYYQWFKGSETPLGVKGLLRPVG